MKIIVEGKKDSEERFLCKSCGCVFDMREDEFIFPFSEKSIALVTKCPCCQKTVYKGIGDEQ